MHFSPCVLAMTALTTLTSVSAALYPTNPVAKTVYNAGQLALITWIDNGHKPHLKDMGLVKLDLYCENHAYVTTLATGVAPITRSHMVFISPNILCNGSVFTLRFISTNPPSRIYSADFTITNTPDTTPPDQIDSATTTAPLQTLVLPNATVASQISSTSNAVSATTIYAEPLGNGQGGTGNRIHNGAGKSASKRVDLEKIKFRLVFILWPALIGISMAL